MFKWKYLALLILPIAAMAADDVISVDRAIPYSSELAFPNEQNLAPEISDFSVNNVTLMSNDAGERWAVLTITNDASGRRTIQHKHLMGLVANGERVHPAEFSQSFNGGETLSLTVYFGESKFPLLSVYSRAKS